MLNSWSSPDHDPEAFRLSLVGHLEELRNRIIRCLVSLVVTWTIGWFLGPVLNGAIEKLGKSSMLPVLTKLGVPYQPVLHSVTEAFMIQMKLSFKIALLVCIPIIVFEIWGFIAPGLKPHEQRPFRRLAPVSVLLFLMGAGFSIIILPSALQWFAEQFASWPGTGLFQKAGTLTEFCLNMVLAFGIGFQLPLVVWALGALNLLSAETLLKYWRQSVTFIFIAAAVITPSNDPFSMLMMAVPLCLLFIVSVFAVKFTQKKQKERKALRDADSAPFPIEDEPKELASVGTDGSESNE